MKPAAQRDMRGAHWLLFDEFEIGASEPASPAKPEPAAAEAPESPLRLAPARGAPRE